MTYYILGKSIEGNGRIIMDGLEPKGKKTRRIEAVCELEIAHAIELRARQMAGTESGPIPAGFRGEAVRDLIKRGADTVPGLSERANALAALERTEQG